MYKRQIYKKGDRCDPRNYRPITLLNTDYKVFTRVLANRMKKAVHEFVSKCQKGFVPDGLHSRGHSPAQTSRSIH